MDGKLRTMPLPSKDMLIAVISKQVVILINPPPIVIDR